MSKCVTLSHGKLGSHDEERLSENVRAVIWQDSQYIKSKMWLVSTFSTFLGVICACASAFSPPEYSACISKDFGHGGTVCVCSEDHCDAFSEGTPLKTGEYAVYTSTKDGDRFKLRKTTFNNSLNSNSPQIGTKLVINASVSFQKILGFGGAFTGA